jgi:hypothetical protein
LKIFQHHRHSVRVHDHDSVHSRFPALVPDPQPRIAGAGAHRVRHQVIVLRRQRPCRLRLVLTDRLFWVWLTKCDLNSSIPWYSSTGDRDRMVSQGPSHPLAMAITPYWTTQDECRNPRPDLPDELCQPVVGARRASTANCSSSAWMSARPQSGGICRGAPRPLPRLGVAFCTTT